MRFRMNTDRNELEFYVFVVHLLIIITSLGHDHLAGNLISGNLYQKLNLSSLLRAPWAMSTLLMYQRSFRILA